MLFLNHLFLLSSYVSLIVHNHLFRLLVNLVNVPFRITKEVLYIKGYWETDEQVSISISCATLASRTFALKLSSLAPAQTPASAWTEGGYIISYIISLISDVDRVLPILDVVSNRPEF